MYLVESETAQKVWESVLAKMKNEYDVNAYSTFFLPLIPKEFKDGKLIVEAPSRFVKEVISSDVFSMKINDCLKEITNTDFKIEVKEKSEIEKEAIMPAVNNLKLNSTLNPSFSFNNFRSAAISFSNAVFTLYK